MWENWCRCCSRYIPDMGNGGRKHACAMMVESAPAHSKGPGKGKGSKGGKGKVVTPISNNNTSKAFMDHKKAMAEKRAAFKRQAEADQLAMREAARNKKQKKAE